MVDPHVNMDHISGITKPSPYLFFSLFLLTWNIIFTLVGVDHNKGDPLADEVVQKNKNSYIVSLVLFFIFCVGILSVKYIFVCATQRPRRWQQWCKLTVTLLFDFTFVVMGTLYLAGNNQPIFLCSGMNSTTAKDVCIEQSSVILGLSLLLHTALYVAGALKLKPTDLLTLPVIGRIRKAYQNILQLAALTILLDQTFSTVVRFITHVDIEIDESPNCGCVGNTTNCSSEMETGGFFLGLTLIMLFIILGIVVKSYKDYCSCYKSDQCCCHCCENIWIFILYILAIAFMILYTLADNRWLWKCTFAAKGDPTTGRIWMLITSLFISFLWVALYLFVICLPGVGIVCERKRFFAENDYVSVLAEMKNNECMCKDAKLRIRTGMAVKETRKFSSGIAVEENYGSVGITLPIEEDIACKKGMHYCWQGCLKSCDKPIDWLLSSSPRGECGCNCNDMTADEETLMFTYMGKKMNFRNATVSRDGTIQMNDGEEQEPLPAGTELYVILKSKVHSSQAQHVNCTLF